MWLWAGTAIRPLRDSLGREAAEELSADLIMQMDEALLRMYANPSKEDEAVGRPAPPQDLRNGQGEDRLVEESLCSKVRSSLSAAMSSKGHRRSTLLALRVIRMHPNMTHMPSAAAEPAAELPEEPGVGGAAAPD